MFDSLRSLFRRHHPAPRRDFAAAQLNRWTQFFNSLEASHRERQRSLAALRSHSRDLVKNNAYMRRFVSLCSTHIVGPEGINFESEITGNLGKPKEDWNDQIESQFGDFSRAVSVDGKLSRADFEQLVAETVATDGECLIRKVRGFPNRWHFAVELIDADRLDHQYDQPLPNGNRVIMGVEVDPWGAPLAYHLWTDHPSDYSTPRPRERVRVPADQIIHVHRSERTRDTRGIPWATPVMVQLNMLGRLWTAELAAANFEANRVAVIKGTGDGVGDPKETAAELTSDILTVLGLDPDQDIVFPQLQHPNAILPQFSMALIKGIAAGLGVAYHSLAGDVSDANYSSARVALLEERDNWRKLQGWFIQTVCDPIYRAWLEMAILSGQINLPVLDFQRLCVPRWWPRTWDWVDPQKDEAAAWNAIIHGLSTHQEELGRQGRDWREVFRQLKEEQSYAKECGLVWPIQSATPMKPEVPNADDAKS